MFVFYFSFMFFFAKTVCYVLSVVYSDIMLWISVFIYVIIKYQKFYALLKTVSCRNNFRFNQVQHKHQGFVFFKQGEIVEPSGVQALKNPNPLKDVEALAEFAAAVLFQLGSGVDCVCNPPLD